MICGIKLGKCGGWKLRNSSIFDESNTGTATQLSFRFALSVPLDTFSSIATITHFCSTTTCNTTCNTICNTTRESARYRTVSAHFAHRERMRHRTHTQVVLRAIPKSV